MANTSSAEKQNRKRIKQRARNLFHLTKTRTIVKKAINTLSLAKPGEKVEEQVFAATCQLDKAAQKGVLKRKTASRKISRLAKALAKVKQGQQASLAAS